MYFKRLELIGFKSFGEKTILDFEPGVTAVVGPNGCGKSNVSDAIRWVLGEQSPKSMRGLSMDDVIFNGTSTKEPVNFAEVSLTLSNQSKILPIEYEEVTISRRLYRSGESEYLINKNIIRLKDVQDLLMGTGLGVSNYSVIEQGKIDTFISGKPEMRRELFDEVAGITKYKAKKKEALRKLELTELNLQRVNDIVIEVKRQIGSIERQARKAETYKIDFEKLKRYDLNAGRGALLELGGRKSALAARIEEFQRARQSSEDTLQKTNAELRESRNRLAEIETAFSEIRTRQALLESGIRSGEEKTALHEERIAENAQKAGSLAENLETVRARLVEFDGERTQFFAKYEAILKESEVGESGLAAVQAKYHEVETLIRNAISEIAEIKRLLVDFASRRSQTQNEFTKTESLLQNLKSRRHRLDVEKEKVGREWEAIRGEYETVSGEAGRLVQEVRAKITERELLEQELGEIQHNLKTVREKSSEISHECSSLESRLQVLTEMTERHEGFSQGVRFLLEEARKNELVGRGVVGTLADLVEVERGYELALEIALAAHAQSLVCVTDQDVLMAARILKDQARGYATFVCLEDFSQDAPRKPGVGGFLEARPLADFVRASPRISRLFENLVSGVFVVPSFEKAVAMRRAHPEAVFVTTDGELCKSGAIIGGSLSNSEESLLFGREARLKELKGRLVELNLEKERFRQKETECVARESSLTDSIKIYGIELPRLQVQLADISSRQEHLGREKTKLDEEMELVLSELEETVTEIEEAGAKEIQLKSTLEILEIEEKTKEALLKADQSLVEERAGDKETLLVEITRMKSAQETLYDRRDNAQRDVERVDGMLAELRTSEAEMTQERRVLEERTASLRAEIRRLGDEIAEAAAERERLLVENRGIVTQRETALAGVQQYESRKAKEEEFVIEAQNRHHELQLELSGVEHDADRIRERLSATYQVDVSALEGAEPLQPDDQDLFNAEEIDRIREKIAKMGPVNLVAIEEHEELKKRYDFLTQQQNDLTSAKEDIHKAIIKINRQTREMFADAFTKIQSAFVEYYKLLFGGGTAELVLLDQNDLLESGIEIVARPPGKKLQSITLLSGGEKAMTAIALLFAVLKVKPSPFVILDEVDAPLDELNVQRFATVLHEFVKGSQFIIITHNKRTMSLADVMYGVTMEQSGLSRVVSVRFSGPGGEEVRTDDGRVLV